MAKKLIPTLDVRMTSVDQKHNSVFVNQRLIAAHVGQFAMELFKNEMLAVEPTLMGAHNPDGSQVHQRTSVEQCVERACLGAEKLFAELIKRGWLVEGPKTGELFDVDDASFGLHR
jgi:hypothetical protein